MLLWHGQRDESRGYYESNHLFTKGRTFPLAFNTTFMLTRTSPEPIHVPNYLGRLRHVHPRLNRLPLYPHLPNPLFPHSLLPCPRSQSLLLRRYYPCRLPYLPTYILSMGSHGWRYRILRRSEVSRPLHWDFQSFSRCYGRGATDAGPLGFENGHREKSDVEWHVWYGYCVRSSHSPASILYYRHEALRDCAD